MKFPRHLNNINMKKATFLFTRFINRNGVVSWRVEGRPGGIRIRKNFKTREEAVAERTALEMNAIKAQVVGRVSMRRTKFYGMARWRPGVENSATGCNWELRLTR